MTLSQISHHQSATFLTQEENLKSRTHRRPDRMILSLRRTRSPRECQSPLHVLHSHGTHRGDPHQHRLCHLLPRREKSHCRGDYTYRWSFVQILKRLCRYHLHGSKILKHENLVLRRGLQFRMFWCRHLLRAIPDRKPEQIFPVHALNHRKLLNCLRVQSRKSCSLLCRLLAAKSC